jgi:TolB protein
MARFVAGMALILAVGALNPAAAQQEHIVVTKQGAAKAAISVAGLRSGGDAASAQFLKTLARDLQLSGWFTIVAPEAATVSVDGECRVEAGRLTAQCAVANRPAASIYFRRTFTGDPAQARNLAHAVADAIVEAVKNVPGIASTRIAFIGNRDGGREVYVCDYDGQGLLQITSDRKIGMLPRWGADRKSLVYTSFLSGFPDVYMLDIEGGRRVRLAAYPGLNSGASVSPDGQSMALTLSKDGNPDIYIMDLRSRQLQRVTRTPHAAEASPTWSSDGRRLAFVSDRSGAPQVYAIDRGGGAEKRLTFTGNENVSPDWGPGDRLVFSSRRGGRYQLVVMSMADGKETQVTSEYVDHKSPSWAPNGRHIVFTRTERYQSVVCLLDTMGDPIVKLTSLAGDWHSPAWSR